MKQSRLIKFLWTVIGVLVVGFVALGIITLNRAHAIDQVRFANQGDIDSLKEQLKQAKNPPATTAPLTESVSNQATPTPTPTPKVAVTPTPKTK